MRKSLRIGRLFGIDLNIDSSWLVIFALVAWSLTSLFSHWHPAWGPGMAFLVALASALAFFLSVLFHELAHSLVARLYKVPVRDITLHMFGGVSNIEREPPTPRAEFLIAIVGPFASVALGVAMIFLASFAAGLRADGATFDSAAEAVAHMGPLTTLLVWLGPINVLVGLFNLIPGFPLDGGRVLRSILWFATRDLRKATRWATSIGQLVGWAFVVTGVFMAFGFRVPFFGTGFVPGLWLGLIGLFLRNAAVQHRIGSEIESALVGLHVADVMRTQGPWVSADTTVRSLVSDWFQQDEDVAYPVFDGAAFVGVVSKEQVRSVPLDAWDERRARDVMATSYPILSPTNDAIDALKCLGQRGLRQVPVVWQGALVGMVFLRDLERWLELRAQASVPSSVRPRHA